MQFKDGCLLWGLYAPYSLPSDTDKRVLYSPRAGGGYQISENAITVLTEKKTDALAVKLSGWIWRENFQKALSESSSWKEFPVIHSDTVREAENWPMPTISERQQNLALCIARLTGYVFGKDLGNIARIQQFSGANMDNVYYMCAASYCGDVAELVAFLEAMSEDGFLFRGARDFVFIQLTAQGHQLVEAARHKHVESEQGFVAMSFATAMDAAYEKGLKRGIERAGYKALRVDKEHHNNKIDDEIIAEIRRSKFLVADFTGDRSGVYYEAGFAQGLNIHVIFTVRKDELENLHFDTRQYNHIVWEDSKEEELARQLSERISATLGDGPGKNQESKD